MSHTPVLAVFFNMNRLLVVHFNFSRSLSSGCGGDCGEYPKKEMLAIGCGFMAPSSIKVAIASFKPSGRKTVSECDAVQRRECIVVRPCPKPPTTNSVTHDAAALSVVLGKKKLTGMALPLL